MMYMKMGSACPLNPLTAASSAVRVSTYHRGVSNDLLLTLKFVCNPNEFSAGKPVLVAALPPGDPANHCQFFFEWHTHVACPTTSKTELEKGHYIAFGSM